MTRGLPEPIAGARFALAANTAAGGATRQRLLLLLAAYADAGDSSPPARELSRRLDVSVPRVDALLKRLEQDGLIVVRWRAGEDGRNLYELRLGEHQAAER